MRKNIRLFKEPKKAPQGAFTDLKKLAGSTGFEPANQLPGRSFRKRQLSATQPTPEKYL